MSTWRWDRFQGSPHVLKYLRRDLPCLDAVIARVSGRTAVIQAGGNVGLFAKRLAESFATVYTFEPALELFPALCANAPEPNILRFQAALGDTRGPVRISGARRCSSRGPTHEGLGHVAGPGVVPTLLIDDLALPVCDLIYLDLEGWEWHALKGAVETIQRCRPVLACEVNQNIGFYGESQDGLRAFIAALGYVRVDQQQSDEVFMPLERAA